MAGTKITASGINALFTKLESTRVAHAAGPTQNSTSLGTSFTGYQVTAGGITQPVTIDNIRSALTTLATSSYMGGTNYGTSITTPTRGSLMVETLLTTATQQVDAAAAVCVNDASYHASYNSSYRSGYDSSYRSSYDSGYRSSYRASFNDGYRNGYRASDNSSYRSSYQNVQTSYRYNNSSDYGGNGVICTGNK